MLPRLSVRGRDGLSRFIQWLHIRRGWANEDDVLGLIAFAIGYDDLARVVAVREVGRVEVKRDLEHLPPLSTGGGDFFVFPFRSRDLEIVGIE